MAGLAGFLDRLYAKYHTAEFLGSDPLEFVHEYQDPWDREAVALLAALLAYGNVTQIRRSVSDALERMDGPARFVRSLAETGGPVRANGVFQGFIHRFNVGSDIVLLLKLLSEAWAEHGSLGALFLKGHSEHAPTFESALDVLITRWKKRAREIQLPRGPYFGHLLNSPSDGSVCKRWCMFLRWMGRKDHLDPGLWRKGSALLRRGPVELSPWQLVIPLDTHTGRISGYLGLTERKSLNWKAAIEITSKLREFDPEDPVRYDFALARLGILDLCQKKFRKEICSGCELVSACRFARRHQQEAFVGETAHAAYPH